MEMYIAFVITGIVLFLALFGFINICMLIYKAREKHLAVSTPDTSSAESGPEYEQCKSNAYDRLDNSGYPTDLHQHANLDEGGDATMIVEKNDTAMQMEIIQEGVLKKEKQLAAMPEKKLMETYGNSLWIRALVVFAIVIGLTLPLNLVDDVVYERQHLQAEALDKMMSGWGRAQHVIGPVVVIPYDVWQEEVIYEKDKDGRDYARTQRYKSSLRYKVVLPRAANFNAVINPVERYYGIYAATVYESSVEIAGEFVLPLEKDFAKDLANIYWQEAVFSLGMSGLKSLSSSTPLAWGGHELGSFEPNTQVGNLLGSGFHTALGELATPGSTASFATGLNMRGAETLRFAPVGETSTINISGLWKDPSFSGVILPTSRTITETDFTAFWSIPHLSRSYPQLFTLDEISAEEIRSFTVGVDLYEPVTLYRKVDRSLKYGILFIGLTYAILFSLELYRAGRLHYLQYALVGVAMTVFYLSLLSLAEHLSFLASFIIASAICIGMNTLYIWAATRSSRQGVIIGLALTVLYVCLYILLGLEKYALLVGTGLVLSLVMVLMFSTRHLGQGQMKR